MLPVGSILDRKYDLQEKIGEGAMGTVFRARHVVTQQELAVKVLSASRASETAKARFLREVRLAGSLRHPNVVQVVDAGEDEAAETLYIVMEYLVGRDLEDVFGSGELSRREGLELLLQVLPALAEAHDAGIVHRDLKPENLFRCSDGTAKLLDFGVARDLEGAKVTATGTAMGTPVYMSPEQGLRPKEIDHRSDLWSIGVILYELAASFPPFYDESPHAVVFKANAEPHVPLAEIVPDTPPALAALIDRCLAKEKTGRPADARTIAAGLEQVLADPEAAPFLTAPIAFGSGEVGPSSVPVPLHSSPPPAPGPAAETVEAAVGKRSRGWVGLVALAALVLVGWLGWSLSRPPAESPEPVARPAEPPEGTDERRESAEPAPEPVPIQPVVDEPEPEPRLARRGPTERRERPAPEPEPVREPSPPPAEPRTEEPAVAPEPEPTMTEEPVATAEPEPTMAAEPAAAAEPEPTMAAEPVVRREAPSSDRPTRRTRRRAARAPAREPEPPPLTF